MTHPTGAGWALPSAADLGADLPLSTGTGPRPVRAPGNTDTTDTPRAARCADHGADHAVADHGVAGPVGVPPALAAAAAATPPTGTAAVRPPPQLIGHGPAQPPAGADELHPALVAAVRSAAPELSAAAAVVGDPALVAAGIGATGAAMARLSVPPAATQLVDWSRFGVVVPVLAGSSAAGASVLAAALSDALALSGRRVLLVDAADPARSGLAAAAPAEDLQVRRLHPGMQLRYSWRHQSLLARMESRYPITPAMVPPPPAWLPDRGPVQVTVVDIGHDGWRAAADPLLGAGCWLRRGQPASLPIIVVRPTRPSLHQAEQVLARLSGWFDARVAEPPAQLVVVGARRWPRRVAGAAGSRLDPLITDAVFLPRHRGVETGGVTADLLPPALIAALIPLLQDRGLIDHPRKGRHN